MENILENPNPIVMPKYNKDSYLITGKKMGLFMLVVSSHGDENDNVMFSDNTYWNNGKPRYVFYALKFKVNVEFIETFRNSKIIHLIKEPILENPNLKNVPKVLVLQHCRGGDQIDLDSRTDSDSDSDSIATDSEMESDLESDCETDGALNERSHRLVSMFIC